MPESGACWGKIIPIAKYILVKSICIKFHKTQKTSYKKNILSDSNCHTFQKRHITSIMNTIKLNEQKSCLILIHYQTYINYLRIEHSFYDTVKSIVCENVKHLDLTTSN